MEKSKLMGNNIKKESYQMPVKAPVKPAKCDTKGCDLSKGYRGMAMPKPAKK
jgi:hypothetical protein